MSTKAAEKYLKAYLVDRGITFPRTHDLILLIDSYILQNDFNFIEIKESAISMTEFAVSTGYPEMADSSDFDVAWNAFKDMNLIRDLVLMRLI